MKIIDASQLFLILAGFLRRLIWLSNSSLSSLSVLLLPGIDGFIGINFFNLFGERYTAFGFFDRLIHNDSAHLTLKVCAGLSILTSCVLLILSVGIPAMKQIE